VDWSKEDVIAFVHITSRIADRTHDELLFDVEGTGTPYFCFLDADGNVIARLNENDDLAAFETGRKDILRWRALLAKAKAGDKSAAIDAEILACLLGQQDYYDLEEKLEGFEPNEAQAKQMRGLEAEVTIAESQQMLRQSRDKETREGVAEDFEMLVEEDKIPLRETSRMFFWATLGRYAADKGKTELLKRSVEELRKLPMPEGRRGERMKTFLEGLEAKLVKK